MTRKILQISDCHLVVAGAELLGVDTQASLEAVLAQATAQHAADAIIASGDLAHDPVPEVYARFLQTVRDASSAPLLCLPGNHDVLTAMAQAGLPLAPLTLPPWQLVPLDSHVDEEPQALISAADRAATAAMLAGSEMPFVLVATHHPPVLINCPWLDRDRIQNGEELVEWLSECSAVRGTSRLRGVVFGHAHQEVVGRLSGLPLWGTPSTCFQFLPESETFSLDTQPPGYRWLFLEDDGSITTEVGRVQGFAMEPRTPQLS